MASRKMALIGCRGHWQAALADIPNIDRAALVALSAGGDSIEPAQRWCEKNGQTPIVEDDYRKMLDRAKPDIAIVCGPFEQHAAMSIEAMGRGIHVLCEKPVALTFDELDAMRKAHEKNANVHLAGMMFKRYSAGFYTAAKLIREGAIGNVRLLNARKSYKLGQRPAFYHDRPTYGGTIPWVGSHAIDWVMWFAGDAKFKSVSAEHSATQNRGNGTMELSASCQFRLEEERIASVSIDVLRPASAPTHDDDWARVVGTDGVMEVRTNAITLLNAKSDGSVQSAACDTTLLREFIGHVEGKQKSMLNSESTFALTDACLRARQAADESRIVQF